MLFDLVSITETLWALAAGLLILIITSALLIRRRRSRRHPLARPKPEPAHAPEPQALTLPPPKLASFTLTTFKALAPFDRTQPHWEAQSRSWQDAMTQLGQRLRTHGVHQIILSHGTFVGHDPFDVIELIRGSFPAAAKRLDQRLFMQLNSRREALFQDLGNFTLEYTQLLAAACLLPVTRFTWSSANHHLARLMGALDLLKALAPLAEDSPPKGRLLLIGHSHAGQLFAILTQLLRLDAGADTLLAIAEKSGYQTAPSRAYLRALAAHPVDLVTLGTPPRYHWQLAPHHRLLHLINHRGATPLGGTLSGLLTTRDGDYIQQWGIAGSDALCPIRLHADLNRQLASHLGIGFHLGYWQNAIKKRQRLPDAGHALLIDYLDKGRALNCFSTIFGHGVYTRYEAMLYNMTQIADHLYLAPVPFVDGAKL